MPQPIDQIMRELDAQYQPQATAVQKQIGELPYYEAEQQKGLDQAKTNAFSDITAGANARGVVYSGIPIGEQAKYVGSQYLPAVANLKQQISERGGNLQDSLGKIRQQQSQQAYGIRNDQLQLEAQQQAAQQKLALQRETAGIKAASKAPVQPKAQDIISYFINADSQYGKYSSNSTNYHRWQAAEQALQEAGYSPQSAQIKKLTTAAFGSPAERKRLGV